MRMLRWLIRLRGILCVQQLIPPPTVKPSFKASRIIVWNLIFLSFHQVADNVNAFKLFYRVLEVFLLLIYFLFKLLDRILVYTLKTQSVLHLLYVEASSALPNRLVEAGGGRAKRDYAKEEVESY